MGWFFAISLPPSANSAYMIYKHFLNERVNKTSWSNPRQTRICYISRLWVIINALLKKISLYLLSHFRIRIIVLTCPASLREISRNHACLQCKITQITMMRGQYYFTWNLRSLSVSSCSCEDSRVPLLNLYYDISIAEDLHCLKAVDRNFVRNGGTTRTHSSLCSWACVSQQIANNVLFWLRLSKI